MKPEPIFLTEAQVLEFHAEQIRLFGGAAGLLDESAMSSAVRASQNVYCYVEDCSIFDLAASYAFHLGKNHAFRDGNKRIAIASAINFLKLNGWIVTRDQTDNVLALVTSQLSEARFSQELRRASRRTLRRFLADVFRR